MTPVATNLVIPGIVMVIALVVGAALGLAEPVYPTRTYKGLVYVVFAVTTYLIIFNIPLYPGNLWVVGSILLGLAVAAPIAGRLE